MFGADPSSPPVAAPHGQSDGRAEPGPVRRESAGADFYVFMGLGVAAMGIAGWSSFSSPLLLLPVALPWITAAYIAFRRGGATLLAVGRGALPIGLPALLVGVLLAVRAFMGSNTLATVAEAAVPSLAIGLLFWAAAAWVDPVTRAHPGWLAYLGLLALALGYGSAHVLNTVLDRTAPERVEAAVVDRWSSVPRATRSGSAFRSPSYTLDLEGFGPVETSYDVYAVTIKGARACVEVHPGALGLRWVTVERCPAPASRTR